MATRGADIVRKKIVSKLLQNHRDRTLFLVAVRYGMNVNELVLAVLAQPLFHQVVKSGEVTKTSTIGVCHLLQLINSAVKGFPSFSSRKSSKYLILALLSNGYF